MNTQKNGAPWKDEYDRRNLVSSCDGTSWDFLEPRPWGRLAVTIIVFLMMGLGAMWLQHLHKADTELIKKYDQGKPAPITVQRFP